MIESLELRRLLAADLNITDSVVPANDNAVALADTIVGNTSAAQTFTLASAGADPVNVTNFAVGGANSADFGVTVKDDLGATVAGADFSIAAGVNYTIEVTFSPSLVGAEAAQITFNTDDPGLASATLDLDGIGLAAPAPEIEVTDDDAPTDDLAISFPNTIEGQTSAAGIFTITNSGDLGLNVSNFAVGGADPGEFDVTVKNQLGATVGTTSFTIPASLAYTIEVKFEPTTAGAMSAQIAFDTDDADESSVTLDISGTGLPTPDPEITITDTVGAADDLAMTFGDTPVGDTSGEEEFSLINAGIGDLDVTNVTITGANPGDFAVTIRDNLGQEVGSDDFTIPQGQTYTLAVVFAPTVLNSLTAQITFTTNDPDDGEGSITLDLAGQATESAVSEPDAPTDLLVRPRSSTRLDLSWTDNSDVETAYEIYESDTVDGLFVLRATLGEDATSYIRKGLTVSQTVFFRVIAVNNNGWSTAAAGSGTTPKDPAGGTVATARNLGKIIASTYKRGNVGAGDAQDWYRLVMVVDGDLRLGLTDLEEDADLHLMRLNADGTTTPLASSTNGDTDDEFINRSLTQGVYIARVVRGFSGVNTFYRLNLEADYAGPSLATARELGIIGAVRKVRDFVGATDEFDLFRFTLSGTRNLQISLSELTDDADLTLLRADGSVIEASEELGSANELITRVLAKGTYYLRVQQFANTNFLLRLASA